MGVEARDPIRGLNGNEHEGLGRHKRRPCAGGTRGRALIVLNTNVISELMRPQPGPRVLAWADDLDPEDGVITATALAHGAPLITRNGSDFAEIGLELINPWDWS